ncbi:MAG: gliding motility protein GldN [Crocinitomicaceae bacterium]
MKNVLIACIVLIGLSANAQNEEINGGPVNVPSDGIIDGVFIQEHIPTKRMIPYEHVREADAIWSRRVWESIDLREKINHNLYYPKDEISGNGVWTRNASRWSLWTVIRTHVLNGDLTVFSPYDPILKGQGALDGDQLKYPIKPQPGLNYFTDSIFRSELAYYIAEIGMPGTVKLIDEDPNSPNFQQELITIDAQGVKSYVYDPPDTTWTMSEDIVQYRLKEDWFFDKQRSVLDVRIIAMAPVRYGKEKINGKTQITGLEEMFWLYFPHCRFVFNNYFVYNAKNDAQWMSFDDVFWKRRFNAVAYKQSNTFDRDIETYRSGVDALYESDRIKNEIRNIEHDVWSF